MGANSKPILSVLVDAEKKEQFAKLAKEHGCSMGSLLNQAIDKMLKANTIHVYQDSPIGSFDIEELVRKYVDQAVSPIAAKVDELSTQVDEFNQRIDFKPSEKVQGKVPKSTRSKPLSH
jgi:hypothetical protein